MHFLGSLWCWFLLSLGDLFFICKIGKLLSNDVFVLHFVPVTFFFGSCNSFLLLLYFPLSYLFILKKLKKKKLFMVLSFQSYFLAFWSKLVSQLFSYNSVKIFIVCLYNCMEAV